jgi:ABC-type Na+ efflux pump permease subunit
MLPIVQRELRVAARNPKLYKIRLRLGLLVTVVAAGLLVFSNPGGAPGAFFWILSRLALLFCLLEGPRKTSDSISEERREGTLGFLFLSELSGVDVVLGKLSAAFIRSFNGLLAFVPILAITLLMGGTTGGEFWRTVLVLGLALVTSLSVCLAVSAARRDRGVGTCFAVLTILCFLPPALGEILRASKVIADASIFHAASPVFLLAIASDASRVFSPEPFWIGAAIQCALGLGAIGLASLITPRVWQDKPARAQAPLKGRSGGDEAVRVAKRRALLDRNPILWLAYPERRHRWFSWVFFVLAVILAVVCVFAATEGFGAGEAFVFAGLSVFILSLLLFIQLASQASASLAEARHNGTLELLLSTPLKVRDILQGQWLALRKMFLPAALVIAAFGIYLWGLGIISLEVGRMFWFGKSTLELVLEFFVLGWVGMWSGLVSKNPNRAFFRTIFLGLLVPYLFCTPTLLNQVILLAVAMGEVKARFRRFVAEKYLQVPEFVLPPPGAQTAGPPVIR